MKKILFFMLLCFTTLTTFASGGITHMFIADKAVELLPDSELRALLTKYHDEYLVGAYYPDSGYLGDKVYGEVSHWDPFIFAFTDYIKNTYPNAAKTNPKLVAFLFGIAVHRMSDEITHHTFYPYMENYDFSDEPEKTQDYGDVGIDLLLTIDKSLWSTQPKTWWLPLKDLLAVYQTIGENSVTAKEIIKNNAILSLAGYGERLIAAPAYVYLQWKMPWTASHYYDWTEGGILMDEQKVAEYQTKLWARLKGTGSMIAAQNGATHSNIKTQAPMQFAADVLKEGIVTINQDNDTNDGSVTLHEPVIEKLSEFNAKVKNILDKL